MEKARPRTDALSFLIRVVLPAPEGAEITKTLPSLSGRLIGPGTLTRCFAPVPVVFRSRISFQWPGCQPRRQPGEYRTSLTAGYWLRGSIPEEGNRASCLLLMYCLQSADGPGPDGFENGSTPPRYPTVRPGKQPPGRGGRNRRARPPATPEAGFQAVAGCTAGSALHALRLPCGETRDGPAAR